MSTATHEQGLHERLLRGYLQKEKVTFEGITIKYDDLEHDDQPTDSLPARNNDLLPSGPAPPAVVKAGRDLNLKEVICRIPKTSLLSPYNCPEAAELLSKNGLWKKGRWAKSCGRRNENDNQSDENDNQSDQSMTSNKLILDNEAGLLKGFEKVKEQIQKEHRAFLLREDEEHEEVTKRLVTNRCYLEGTKFTSSTKTTPSEKEGKEVEERKRTRSLKIDTEIEELDWKSSFSAVTFCVFFELVVFGRKSRFYDFLKSLPGEEMVHQLPVFWSSENRAVFEGDNTLATLFRMYVEREMEEKGDRDAGGDGVSTAASTPIKTDPREFETTSTSRNSATPGRSEKLNEKEDDANLLRGENKKEIEEKQEDGKEQEEKEEEGNLKEKEGKLKEKEEQDVSEGDQPEAFLSSGTILTRTQLRRKRAILHRQWMESCLMIIDYVCDQLAPDQWKESSLMIIDYVCDQLYLRDQLALGHPGGEAIKGIVRAWARDMFSWDTMFRRAYMLSSSRAFYVDEKHKESLIPLADMFNHRGGIGGLKSTQLRYNLDAAMKIECDSAIELSDADEPASKRRKLQGTDQNAAEGIAVATKTAATKIVAAKTVPCVEISVQNAYPLEHDEVRRTRLPWDNVKSEVKSETGEDFTSCKDVASQKDIASQNIASQKHTASKDEALAAKVIKKGAELFNCYGELSNPQLLEEYGFVDFEVDRSNGEMNGEMSMNFRYCNPHDSILIQDVEVDNFFRKWWVGEMERRWRLLGGNVDDNDDDVNDDEGKSNKRRRDEEQESRQLVWNELYDERIDILSDLDLLAEVAETGEFKIKRALFWAPDILWFCYVLGESGGADEAMSKITEAPSSSTENSNDSTSNPVESLTIATQQETKTLLKELKPIAKKLRTKGPFRREFLKKIFQGDAAFVCERAPAGAQETLGHAANPEDPLEDPQNAVSQARLLLQKVIEHVVEHRYSALFSEKQVSMKQERSRLRVGRSKINIVNKCTKLLDETEMVVEKAMLKLEKTKKEKGAKKDEQKQERVNTERLNAIIKAGLVRASELDVLRRSCVWENWYAEGKLEWPYVFDENPRKA